jgi:hypothetical protein
MVDHALSLEAQEATVRPALQLLDVVLQNCRHAGEQHLRSQGA